VNNNYYSYLRQQALPFIIKSCLTGFFLSFAYASVLAQASVSLPPVADAFVRNGSYAGINYGNDTTLIVKGSTSSGFTRSSYFKFSLGTLTNISSAKLRIYGSNTESTANISISCYGVNNDTWTESGITYSNAPAALTTPSGSAGVTNMAQYYELDVTDYVKTQFDADKVVSFLVKDPANQNKNLVFNSKENNTNRPQLVIDTTRSAVGQSNALLFVENLDKFPSNDHFVFSRVQIPWTRDSVYYNANHDSLTVRIHNKGINSLIIKNLSLSNDTTWKFAKLKGYTYVPATSLPLTISSGSYADLTVKFVAADAGTRVKILHDTLTIVSNDDKFPSKSVFFDGIWQKKGEDSNEPWVQEIITAFGFKTRTGFGHTDGNYGDSTKLKGDEIRPSYFLRADTSRPVAITQMSAYHGCCTATEKIMWYAKGSDILTTVFTHIGRDGQTVLPRKGSATPAAGVISPTKAFGFKVGSKDYTDASKNPGGKIGIRVWKAFDAAGKIIPNAYIISNDYLGSEYTNFDYNDNTFFVTNVKPEKGTAYFSALTSAPSALDFGEKLLQSANSLTLNLSSLGQNYADGSKDPAITVSSVAIVGENKSEFSAVMPLKTTLYPQENSTLTLQFNPASEGLKIADLLVYYNNSQSPLRVPLYGIAKATSTAVTANYRINSGSVAPITINGKTWSADNQFSFDNLEPYTNSKLTEIAGTDEDSLYLKEQSSNGDKKPFRYEFPVANGNYVVRLHFAEIYWGAPGSGIEGGAGSRVMSVSLEGQLRLVNFDVTQEAGGATAIIKNIPVTVTDGKLNIDFSATVNRPMVVAVEVYSFRASAAARQMVNNIAPVEDNHKKARIYPNPVHKMLRVQFPANYSGSSILQIADAAGRIYEIGKTQLQPGGSNIAVNISNLSLKPGFYYLKILSATKTDIIKLIVE